MGNTFSEPTTPENHNKTTDVYERIAHIRMCYNRDCQKVDVNFQKGLMSIGMANKEKETLKHTFDKEEAELLKMLQ